MQLYSHSYLASSMFKNKVAAALLVSVAIWEDATPTAAFPSMNELAQVELGRILGKALKNAEVRSHIPAHLAQRLNATPWEIGCPKDLLSAFASALPAHQQEVAGNDILCMGHVDAAFDMVRRRGTAKQDHEFDMMARNAVRVLGIPKEEARGVATLAEECYAAIYQQLATIS